MNTFGQAPQKVFSIMYHDVVEGRDYDASGFPGTHARLYKLERTDFALHLEAINRARSRRLVKNRKDSIVFLTFDDGGISALRYIAPLLEQNGWRGHFFVATDWIGRPGFLNADQIRELDRRGHAIGSHSSSHPTRMASISRDRLLFEWTTSVRLLAEIVDHPVTMASVPGGYYSQTVAETAARAGIETLFTSEPTAAIHIVNDCCVLGRYTIQRWMRPKWSAGFAAGRLTPRLEEALSWKVKQVAKSIGGKLYVRSQQALFSKQR